MGKSCTASDTVMNVRNVFTSAGNISFSRRILHRGLESVVLVIVFVEPVMFG